MASSRGKRENSKAETCITLWYVSISLVVTYLAYGLAERSPARFPSLFGWALVFFYIAAAVFSWWKAKDPSLSDGSTLWRRHFFFAHVGPAGGFLWFAGLIGGAVFKSPFLLHLFFVPYWCLVYTVYNVYTLYDGTAGLAGCAMFALCIPGQYILAAVVTDAILRARDRRRRAAWLLASAFCILVFVLYFAVGADPHDRDSMYPTGPQAAAIVIVHGLAAAGLILLALHSWRRGSSRAVGSP